MGEISNAYVCLMGVGVVFFGLICIIILCTVMSWLCKLAAKPKTPAPAPVPAAAPAPVQPGPAASGNSDMDVITAVITAAILAATADRQGGTAGRRPIASGRKTIQPYIPPVYNTPPRHGSGTPVRRPVNKRQEMISAVSAAIAEERGADISGIRILSFKKVN